jgi:yecA family protein
MDTLASTAMPAPPDPTGRSFALLAQAERDRLSQLLRPLPWIDGLIAAMVVAPEATQEMAESDEALDWLYLIWSEGSQAAVGELSLPQSAEIVDPVMAHYVHVAEALCDDPEAYRPYLGGPGDPLEAASQWAAGFWGGLSLQPGAWAPLLEDEDALPLLVAILSLVQDADMPESVRADADSPFRNMPPERREHMRRSTLEMLPEIVLALHDYSLGYDEAGDSE